MSSGRMSVMARLCLTKDNYFWGLFHKGKVSLLTGIHSWQSVWGKCSRWPAGLFVLPWRCFLSILLYSSVSISLSRSLSVSFSLSLQWVQQVTKVTSNLRSCVGRLTTVTWPCWRAENGSKQNSRTASGTDIDNASRALKEFDENSNNYAA